MPDFREKIGEYVGKFLDILGIDRFYGITIIVLLIVLSYWKDFQNWRNIPGWKKGIIGSTTVGAFIMILFCLFRLFGIFTLE